MSVSDKLSREAVERYTFLKIFHSNAGPNLNFHRESSLIHASFFLMSQTQTRRTVHVLVQDSLTIRQE
jgi:hypothetical protein